MKIHYFWMENPLFLHGKSAVFVWKIDSFWMEICCFQTENPPFLDENLWFPGQTVLKGVNLVHNTKIRSNGLERNQFGTQYKNQVKWS